MLRRTLFCYSASSRRWAGKTSRHASASAHFPQVAFVDPASLRTSSYGAKESKVFQLDENVDALPVGHQGAVFERNYSFKKIAFKLGYWADAVRLTDPVPTVMTVIPALWGAGVAMTRLLVWEGADPLVLCAPGLPVHLIAFFFAGVFLLRGALVLLAASFGTTVAAVVPPALRPASQGTMSLAERGGLLGTHALLSVVILFNLAPVAAQCACVSVPLLLGATIVRSRGGPQATRYAIWLSSLASAVAVPVGYAAVAGRLDLAVVLPLYAAAAIWSSFHHTLHELVQQREAEQQQQQDALDADVTVSSSALPRVAAPSPASSAIEKVVGGLKTSAPGSVVSSRRGSKLHSFKTRNDPAAAQSDSVAQILPSLMGDTKFYWNVLLAPMTIALVAVGVFSSQTLFYYIGLLVSMMYLQGIIDHVNIFDTWSCRMNYKRNARFGVLMLFFVCCSNGFWGLATEHDPKADKDTANTSSTLHQWLRLHIASNERHYDASDFTWADRFARPVWVQSRILDLQRKEAVPTPGSAAALDDGEGGAHQDLATIPAWMRREYFGQNVANALRLTGLFDEARIQSWEASWYRGLDHYNVFTSIVL